MGQAYAVGADLIPAAELPEQAGALSEPMQVIARNYLSARRRSGEALLDAARWLSEARATAQHGEWYVFLGATSTTENTARRLLDIHKEANRSPQFAEKIAQNWLTFTAAAEIAAPSTSPALRQELINAPEPPSRADVKAAKSAGKSATVADLPAAPPAAPAATASTGELHAPTPEMRGFARPAEPPAHDVWRDAISQLRGAKAQARAVQLQARHFVGQQRRTLLEEIESLQRGLEAARKALEASL